MRKLICVIILILLVATVWSVTLEERKAELQKQKEAVIENAKISIHQINGAIALIDQMIAESVPDSLKKQKNK